MFVGIVVGGASSAILVKEFRWHFGAPLRQYGWAFAGGTLMGLASRMAPVCNVLHIMGGLPVFAVSSLLFLSGLLPGAWVGGLLLTRFVLAEEP